MPKKTIDAPLLTDRALNRATLMRQGLLQRQSVGVAEMLERATLLDAQQSELTDRGAVIEQLDSELRRCQLLSERLAAELAARLTVIETQERELGRRLTLILSVLPGPEHPD